MRSKDGNLLYHRKYRKHSKKWDATPNLTPKRYDYIPQIMSEICKTRTVSNSGLKRKVVLAENHPTHIQKTIGHYNPENTHDIVSSKRIFIKWLLYKLNNYYPKLTNFVSIAIHALLIAKFT